MRVLTADSVHFDVGTGGGDELLVDVGPIPAHCAWMLGVVLGAFVAHLNVHLL
jgi:hypothetical protein